MQPTVDKRAAKLIDAMIAHGLAGTDEHTLLDDLCRGLTSAGVPLLRVVAASDVLHPSFEARMVRWNRDRDVERIELAHSGGSDDSWRRDPFGRLHLSGETRFRRRLGPDLEPGYSELLERLRDEGATDYAAFRLPVGTSRAFGVIDNIMSSWTTDRPDGFAADELDLIERTLPAFGLAIAAAAHVDTARTLLATYLGADAADRVLKGNITRGQPETVRAVIWYCDLANFTRIAGEVPRDELLALLNDYAAALVETVEAHGGHVLKFMGDGILAIFPLDDAAAAAARALDAARAADRVVAGITARRANAGRRTTGFYLALHLGELLYGNFGSERRLDFTVLGPAVNEASRISALCRSLDQRIIVSSAFAAQAGKRRGELVSLGRYALRGVANPQELLTLEPQS
jgi:adenylate cyclase